MPANIAASGNLNADGNGPVIDWPGGTGTVQADYVAGTGSLILDASIAGTTFTTGGSSVTLTGSGLFNFTLMSPCKIRLRLTGSATPNIDWWVGLPNNG